MAHTLTCPVFISYCAKLVSNWMFKQTQIFMFSKRERNRIMPPAVPPEGGSTVPLVLVFNCRDIR